MIFGFLLLSLVPCVLSECVVFHGSVTLGRDEAESFVCVPGILPSELNHAFVTHSWTGSFVRPGEYAIVASLEINSSSQCISVRIRRAQIGSSAITVYHAVVVCRGGEITNVYRQSFSQQEVQINVQNPQPASVSLSPAGIEAFDFSRSILLSSISLGAGSFWSRDDITCNLLVDASGIKSLTTRFAADDLGSLSNLIGHFQVIEWNSSAATLKRDADIDFLAFGSACGVGVMAGNDVNMGSMALRYSKATGALTIAPEYTNVSSELQYLKVLNAVGSVVIDEVRLGAGEDANVSVRTVPDPNYAWPIVLGTGNLFGVPAEPTNDASQLVVAASVVDNMVVVRRVRSNTQPVAISVWVATTLFRPATSVTTDTITTSSSATTTATTKTATAIIAPNSTSTTITLITTNTTFGTQVSSSDNRITLPPSPDDPASISSVESVPDSSQDTADVPPSSSGPTAIDAAIIGGAAGGGAALLLVIVIVLYFCCRARKRRAESTPSKALPLSQLNTVDMSSVREYATGATYGDVSDVRTEGPLETMYGDIGDVRSSTIQPPPRYGDVGDVRTNYASFNVSTRS